ncbi:hypothetical protein VXG46_000711 [Acinetobacter baumannii]|nr:hypothetical protein [Acinetobacter baumannii]EMC7949342.1 hypothetical protein [Acinetobacter baumannii]EMD9691601.1 hypothetical protein [Acinetobacter baumannii]
MIDKLYFNDLSLKGLKSVEQIEILLSRLKFLVDLLDLDCFPDLKFLINVYSQPTEENQPEFIELLLEVQQDMRDYIFAQLNSSYYVNPPTEASLCVFNSDDISLAATHLNHNKEEAILFSFCSHESWNCIQLDFKVENEIISFPNIGDIDSNTPWLTERLAQQLSYSNAIEFIEKIKPRFTNLMFNDSSIEQLKVIDTDVAKLERLERCFTILHEYCEFDWEGSFRLDQINEKGVKLRGESQTTRENDSYMKQRKFKDMNGKSVQFEFHFDVTKAERCYVLPLSQEKKILIGYIGAHLDTTRHN